MAECNCGWPDSGPGMYHRTTCPQWAMPKPGPDLLVDDRPPPTDASRTPDHVIRSAVKLWESIGNGRESVIGRDEFIHAVAPLFMPTVRPLLTVEIPKGIVCSLDMSGVHGWSIDLMNNGELRPGAPAIKISIKADGWGT